MSIDINQLMVPMQVPKPKLLFLFLEPTEVSECCKALPEVELYRKDGEAFGRCSKCKTWTKFVRMK